MNQLSNFLKRLLGRKSRYVLEVYYGLRTFFFYRGESFFCPCCESRVKRFLPLTAGQDGALPGIRCPRCDSHPRHRLLWLYLREYRPELFVHNLRLLHLAPEFCFFRLFRQQANLEYFTADLDSPFAECRLDITSLPFPDGTFDVIFCNHVLEHVGDDSRALAELFRVLKPGGWALVMVPIDNDRVTTFDDARIRTPEARTRYFGQHDHLRQYGADFEQRLEAQGLQVTATAAREVFDNSTLTSCGLDPAEKIFLGLRPVSAL